MNHCTNKRLTAALWFTTAGLFWADTDATSHRFKVQRHK